MDGQAGVTVSGLLRRDGGGFVLRGDDGQDYPLELGRTPVDLVAKRAAVQGVLRADGVLAVAAIRPL